MKLRLKILTVLVAITIICIKIKPNETDDINAILNSRISTEVKIEQLQHKMLTFKFNEPLEANWSTKDKEYYEKLNKVINELNSN